MSSSSEPEMNEFSATLRLDRANPGTEGSIVEVDGPPDLQQRLLDLGFVPGTRIRVIRYATLGDPMQVEVHGYLLSLRKREARAVMIRPGPLTEASARPAH